MDVEMPTTPKPTVRSAINVSRSGPIPTPRSTAATTVTAVARNTAQPPPASPLVPPESHRTRCPLCRRSHRLQHCSIFKSMQPSQRQRVAQAHGHCLNCLSLTDTTQECDSECSCQLCGRLHHTVLHRNSRRDVRRPPAPRSRGAVKRPPPSHPIQHQRSKEYNVMYVQNLLALATVPQRSRCPLCRRTHRLQHCSIFRSMQPPQRQQVAQAHGHCLNCLSTVHTTPECTSVTLCQLCNRQHHTMLHRTPKRTVGRQLAPSRRSQQSSHPDRPRREAAPPFSRPRRQEASTRRRQPRPTYRRSTGLSSVVATLQQLQRLLG
ncbi:uncharacterized protein [Bactrocera oleae]|uniref:uncharacterized protein n=1 Tax=Bactrocera oleae TaxID=104688 RepID=UPI00387E6A80